MATRLRRLSAAALAVTVALTVLPAASFQQDRPWPGASWPAATPESQGLPRPPSTRSIATASGVYGNIDRLVVIRNGHAVVNKRYARDYREISRGHDWSARLRRGVHRPVKDARVQLLPSELASVLPGPRRAHAAVGHEVHGGDGRSASRSAAARSRASTCRFSTFFQDRDLSRVDPRLRQATLDDLLTMRSGIEWHESDRPLDDTNTTYQLEESKDWIEFTLSQPMDADPGTKWVYNSGGSQLLSGIIRKATGQFIDDYANEHLFRPIGIKDFHWKKTPTGHPDTEGGLYLSSEDLAQDRLSLPARRHVERHARAARRHGSARRRRGTRRVSPRAGTTAISGGSRHATVSTCGRAAASADSS